MHQLASWLLVIPLPPCLYLLAITADRRVFCIGRVQRNPGSRAFSKICVCLLSLEGQKRCDCVQHDKSDDPNAKDRAIGAKVQADTIVTSVSVEASYRLATCGRSIGGCGIVYMLRDLLIATHADYHQ